MKPLTDYNRLLHALEVAIGRDQTTIPARQYAAWRHHIKAQIFDRGITVQEAILALDQALRRRREWPVGTGVWQRVRDVVLQNRRQQRPIVKVNRGPQSMSALLRQRA